MDRPLSEDLVRAGSVCEKERTYWLGKFAGKLPRGAVPYDRTRSRIPPRMETIEALQLPLELARHCVRVSNGSSYNLYLLLLSGVAALIHRYSGDDDLVVGSPILRSVAAARPLLNTVVPVRVRMHEGMTFRALVKQAKEVSLEALDHQNWPIELLARALGEGGSGPIRLFDVVCLLKGLHLEEFYHGAGPDLLLGFSEDAESIRLDVRYNGSVYERSTVLRLFADLSELLEVCLQQPDAGTISGSRTEASGGTRPELAPPPARSATSGAVRDALADLWARSLQRDAIGPDENYFDAGGDSFGAIRLVATIREEMGIELGVRDLFAWPTVDELADAIECGAAPIGARSAETRPAGAGEAPELPLAELHPLLSLEQRDLATLIETKELAGLDAATIGYLSHSWASDLGVTREWLAAELFAGKPQLTEIRSVGSSRVGVVTLPLFDDELAASVPSTLKAVEEALRIARRSGARTVSLAGTLPSVLAYGSLIDASSFAELTLTTGHETTACSVLKSVLAVLDHFERPLCEEVVGFLGVGSIGCSVVRLMLATQPHPRKIVLCDVYDKRKFLEDLRQELRDELGYRGSVVTEWAANASGKAILECSTIVGATNVAEVLAVDLLPAGTIVVDDSAPHCFRVDAALRRMQAERDVLLCEAGALTSPEPMAEIRRDSSLVAANRGAQALLRHYEPGRIMGCVLSSVLLLDRHATGLQPTIGKVELENARTCWRVLEQRGFSAGAIQLAGTPVALDALKLSRYGSEGSAC